MCRYRVFPVASKPKSRKTLWILSQVSSLWCKLRPCGHWRLKEGLSRMQGTKIQHSNSKTLFWQAFKGVCRYRIFPIASKPHAWENGVNSFALLQFASHVPKKGGVWQKGYPGRRVGQGRESIYKTSPNRHRFAAATVLQTLLSFEWSQRKASFDLAIKRNIDGSETER